MHYFENNTVPLLIFENISYVFAYIPKQYKDKILFFIEKSYKNEFDIRRKQEEEYLNKHRKEKNYKEIQWHEQNLIRFDNLEDDVTKSYREIIITINSKETSTSQTEAFETAQIDGFIKNGKIEKSISSNRYYDLLNINPINISADQKQKIEDILKSDLEYISKEIQSKQADDFGVLNSIISNLLPLLLKIDQTELWLKLLKITKSWYNCYDLDKLRNAEESKNLAISKEFI
jgi:hypothetical protein